MPENATTQAADEASATPPPSPLERAVLATVEIRNGDRCGSGVLIDPGGLIVTARHVVANRGVSRRTVSVRVLPEGSNEETIPAVVFASHRALDFALAWLRWGHDLPSMPIGDPTCLRHGATVYAVGSPAGHPNTLSRGIISKPRHVERGVEWIQTDAAIGPGNSGGPLADEAGNLVGINLSGLSEFDAIRLALPIDYVTTLIAAALARGRQSCCADSYCALCGDWDREPVTWYCRNCGAPNAGAAP